jgi:hypothetical protein
VTGSSSSVGANRVVASAESTVPSAGGKVLLR